MKKVLSIIALAAITSAFVACGSSNADKAKEEEAAKMAHDSAATAVASPETAAPADSTAAKTETAAAPAAEEKH